MTPEGDERLIFLVYPPRSGSTLLQIMLSQHPAIAISPEVQFAPRIFRQYADPTATLTGDELVQFKQLLQDDTKLYNWKIDTTAYLSRIQAADAISPAAALLDLMRHYRDGASPGASVIGLKKGNLIPRLPRVAAAYPTARFIFAYRDGRASIASMLKNLAFEETERAARRWRSRVRRALTFEETSPDRVYRVRYEDLIVEPETVLRGICNYVDVPFDDRMLQHHRANQDMRFVPHGREDKHRHTSEPISTRYADQWREQLSAEQISVIEQLCGVELQRLGYTLVGDTPSDGWWRRLRRR